MKKILALLLLLLVVGCASKQAVQTDTKDAADKTNVQTTDVSNDALVKESGNGLDEFTAVEDDLGTDAFDEIESDIGDLDW